KPSANGQSGLITQAGVPLAITLAGVDPNAGTLIYTVLAPPAKGTPSGAPPTVTHTPIAGQSGADSFSFKVSDGKYDSGSALVKLKITAPPTAPTAIALSNTGV